MNGVLNMLAGSTRIESRAGRMILNGMPINRITDYTADRYSVLSSPYKTFTLFSVSIISFAFSLFKNFLRALDVFACF